MSRVLAILLVLVVLPTPGCFYKVGSGLMAGILDETGGKGRSEGVDPILEGVVEKALLTELGNQLGQGLQGGLTEVTPDQQERLEAVVDGLVTVATARAGKGLRRDVSPELRAMIQRDIVEAFADGVRGELGGSLEETVDRVVTRAITSLRRNLSDDELKYVTSDLLRDSIYLAMRESNATPSVGDTVQETLEQNVLDPFSNNVENLAMLIANQVDERAKKTEQILQSVIGALIVVLGVIAVLYGVSRRQLRRQQARHTQEAIDLKSFNAVLSQLDDSTRAQVEGKLSEVRTLVRATQEEPET